MNMTYQRQVHITATPDVLVVGGGPAGLCAAVAAARAGAKTMLVEQYGCCGGMATMGLVAPFMTCYEAGGNTMLIRGLFEELVERMVACGGAIHPSEVPARSAFTSYIGPGHLHVTPFDAEALKRVADEMLTEAGVDVLYHTSFLGVEMDGDRVSHVYLHTKEGVEAVAPRMIVDCTGDGDVAAAAGAPFHKGNETGDGKGGVKMQPATMFFRIGNVDTAKVDADIEANKDNFFRKNGINYRSFHWRVAEARENGDWDLERVSIGMFRGVREDEWSINTSRVMHIDGTDSRSLSKAEMIGRQQADYIFKFLVKYVPGCENARLLSVAPVIGIRETRHIHGIKTLQAEDCLNGVVTEDAIMLAANSVDVHGKFGPMSNEYIALEPGVFYGIPYGCLVPQGVSNMLVAGRCLSATSDAAGAVRVMPPCMGMGQAAGVAAAMSAADAIAPKDVDVAALRKKLKEQKVYLG